MKGPSIMGRLKVYCHRYGAATPSELQHNVTEKGLNGQHTDRNICLKDKHAGTNKKAYTVADRSQTAGGCGGGTARHTFGIVK
jgi:hypothetical protein